MKNSKTVGQSEPLPIPLPTRDSDTGSGSSPSTGSECVFEECQAICPHRHDWINRAGGTMSDCTHPEHHHHPPCLPEVCPVFESDDPAGDRLNMRSNEEVEGRHYLPNNKLKDDRHE